MKGKKIQEMSNEELLKHEKTVKTVTSLLCGALLVLFAATIFLNIVKKEFNPLTAVPIALLPILLININTLNEIKKEKKNRNLS
ncbi:hypothetical protein HNP38_001829 [Chryseobacterium defluvii]|uniref:Redox-active disulfide protein 2 n=1 Tax=Chryseobacterium defluvii TaxID=160396 RepID=A0A840KG79_9FLAO|nr:redox-active disulfide protein 2 [Chryseobacterium defluvii]MBB4806533.1 hypothetical protein [Chryseobacterium defluvii]